MSQSNYHSFNEGELDRNIEKLKSDKQMCTFKLNLLRDKATVAASINNHSTFHSFDSLENRLFNLTHQIYELEASEKDRKKSQLSTLTASDETVGDKVCAGLKSSLSLIVRLDALGEDIARFKFTLEVQEASKNSSGNVGGSNASAASAQDGPSSSNDKPTAKKAKTQPKAKNPAVPDPKVKKEPDLPKPPKEKHWAPKGYYYVKPHFRRMPKKKGKEAGEKKALPGSYEIVHID